MKYRVASFVLALVAMWVLTTATSTYAQNAPATGQSSVTTRTIDPAEAQARAASGKFISDNDATGLIPAPVANPQTAVACNTCFTCGGDWPIFAGAVHAVNTGNLTFERGSGCSGALNPANDQNPFLCCR